MVGARHVEVDGVHFLLSTKVRVPGVHAAAVGFGEAIATVVDLAVAVGLAVGIGHLELPVIAQLLVKGGEHRLVLERPG
ncbi:hypothetical protein D3C72_2454960 [compost metagenome]